MSNSNNILEKLYNYFITSKNEVSKRKMKRVLLKTSKKFCQANKKEHLCGNPLRCKTILDICGYLVSHLYTNNISKFLFLETEESRLIAFLDMTPEQKKLLTIFFDLLPKT